MTIVIYTVGCRMATMRAVIAFIDVMAFIVVSFVSWLTFTIIPTGHVNAIGWWFARVQSRCTFIQISFTGGTNIAHTTRTSVWWSADTAIQTHLFANRLKCNFAMRKIYIYIYENTNQYTSWAIEWYGTLFRTFQLLKYQISNLNWSYLRLHWMPSPSKPSLHRQLYDPIVLMHLAFSWHECKPAAHSLNSAQLNLSIRRNPGRQLHTYDPIVFSQAVFKWQWFPNWPPCCAHSSISINWKPVKCSPLHQMKLWNWMRKRKTKNKLTRKRTCTIEAIPLEAGTTGTWIFCIKIKTRGVYVTGMTFSAIVISFYPEK